MTRQAEPVPTPVIDDFCALLCELILHELPPSLLRLSFDATSPTAFVVQAVVSQTATEAELALLESARARGREIVGAGFGLEVVTAATLDQAPEPAAWPVFAAMERA